MVMGPVSPWWHLTLGEIGFGETRCGPSPQQNNLLTADLTTAKHPHLGLALHTWNTLLTQRKKTLEKKAREGDISKISNRQTLQTKKKDLALRQLCNTKIKKKLS